MGNLALELKRLENPPPDYPITNIDGIRDIYIHLNFDFKKTKVEHIYFTKTKAVNRYNVYVDNVFKFVKGKARAWRELSKDDPPVLSERSL